MKNEAQVDCKEMYISLMSRLANDEFGISNTPDHERRLPLADIIRLTYKSGLFLMNVVKREYKKAKDKNNCDEKLVWSLKYILDLDADAKRTKKAAQAKQRRLESRTKRINCVAT